MIRTLAALCLTALAAACAHGPSGDRLRLIDLTDDYAQVWAETQPLPGGERALRFRESFAARLPGFYDVKRLEPFGVTPAQYDEFVGKMLESHPKRRDAVAKVSREFGAFFEPALASFEAAFGPMRGYPPIYLVDGHNEFDGGMRELPEGGRLLFGADMIAKLYAGKPIQAFFHHELFHLYHARRFAECEQVWCSLWTEGLAVYVAARLNPRASDESLLLTVPVPLRPAIDAHRQEAVCAVRTRLTSESKTDYAPLFMGGKEPLSPNLPRRFGYYVGYLVAEEIGRSLTLQQLAGLDQAAARPLIEEALGRLASCG